MPTRESRTEDPSETRAPRKTREYARALMSWFLQRFAGSHFTEHPSSSALISVAQAVPANGYSIIYYSLG